LLAPATALHYKVCSLLTEAVNCIVISFFGKYGKVFIYLILRVTRALESFTFKLLISSCTGHFELSLKAHVEVLGNQRLKKLLSSLFINHLVILVSIFIVMSKCLLNECSAPLRKASYDLIL